MAQTLAEMACLNVRELLLVNWHPLFTSVCLVKFSDTVWKKIVTCAALLYGDGPKKLTSVPEQVRQLREAVKMFPKTNVKLLCVVPSVNVNEPQIPAHTLSLSPYIIPDGTNVKPALKSEEISEKLVALKTSLKESFHLSRQKAAEVHVMMLSDTDRSIKWEEPHALPVAYAMLGEINLSSKV